MKESERNGLRNELSYRKEQYIVACKTGDESGAWIAEQQIKDIKKRLGLD